MSGNFFSKFDSEYFSLIIFLKYLLILLLMLIFVTKMTLLEKNKICRTFRAVGHLGTLQSSITAFVYLVNFITVWRISSCTEFNKAASFIAFIESSLTRKFDIKIKAHVLRSEINICII